jgi:cell division transport system permease protein
MAIKVDYVARETLQNLKRNFLMTSAAVLTVGISLALVGGALLLKRGVDNATLQWRGGVELSIFMKPEASQTESYAVERELRAMPEVKKINYVSQREAFAEFQQMFRDNPDFAESLTVDQMPPSYRVVPREAEQVELIGERFNERAGVEEVVYAKDQIKALLKVTRILQVMLWAVALVLLLAASMLILNTIRMAIFARRREVAVMKLVGATNWFIRIPFMFEGLFQGVAGAAAAFGVVWIVRNFAQNSVRNVELFHQFAVSTADVASTGIFLIFVGAMVGAVGSAFAVTRFLDV